MQLTSVLCCSMQPHCDMLLLRRCCWQLATRSGRQRQSSWSSGRSAAGPASTPPPATSSAQTASCTRPSSEQSRCCTPCAAASHCPAKSARLHSCVLPIWCRASGLCFEAKGKVLSWQDGTDVVLCDTSGRLHTNLRLMEELAKCRRSLEKCLPGAPHETLLVLDGTTGPSLASGTMAATHPLLNPALSAPVASCWCSYKRCCSLV